METEIDTLRSLAEITKYSSKTIDTEYYIKLIQAIQCKLLLELKDSEIDYISYNKDKSKIIQSILPAICLVEMLKR